MQMFTPKKMMLSFLVPLAAFGLACSPEEDGTGLVQQPEVEGADEPVVIEANCKIGETVIDGLPSGDQACNDGNAFDKAVKTMANPVHARSIIYDVESGTQINGTFEAPGLGSTYKMFLTVFDPGSFDLTYYDMSDGLWCIGTQRGREKLLGATSNRSRSSKATTS